LLSALRSKQPNRMRKFSDVESYDIDELIEQHRLLMAEASAANKAEDKPGISMVARAAASMRSALGISDSEAKRWVESVLTAAHKSPTKLTSDALEAYFKTRHDGGADHARAA
jgi:hypothetical protein